MQIHTNKWLTDVEIEKTKRKLERNNSKVKVRRMARK